MNKFIKHNTTKKMLSFILTSLTTASFACTAINIKAQDGSVIAGRTMEWSYDIGWELLSVPKDTSYQLTAPQNLNLPPIKLKTKYAYMAIASAKVSDGIIEGQNTAGLGISANFFPGYAVYQDITPKDHYYVSIFKALGWMLGSFSNVEEVKQGLMQYKLWGDKNSKLPITLHFVITDKTGNSIVVEYINGQMKEYKNATGVFTNSPSYDWHITNLRNYINMTNQNARAINGNDQSILPLSEGTGLHGLPGDFTSSSRFVRSTYLLYYANQTPDAASATQLVGHILNNSDIPSGAVKHQTAKGTLYETTQWVIIKDLTHNKFYYTDYAHRLNYVEVDLTNLTTHALKIPLSEIKIPQPLDITNSLISK